MGQVLGQVLGQIPGQMIYMLNCTPDVCGKFEQITLGKAHGALERHV